MTTIHSYNATQKKPSMAQSKKGLERRGETAAVNLIPIKDRGSQSGRLVYPRVKVQGKNSKACLFELPTADGSARGSHRADGQRKKKRNSYKRNHAAMKESQRDLSEGRLAVPNPSYTATPPRVRWSVRILFHSKDSSIFDQGSGIGIEQAVFQICVSGTIIEWGL